MYVCLYVPVCEMFWFIITGICDRLCCALITSLSDSDFKIYLFVLAGHVQSRVVYYLMNIHVLPRTIYLTRVSITHVFPHKLAIKYIYILKKEILRYAHRMKF